MSNKNTDAYYWAQAPKELLGAKMAQKIKAFYATADNFGRIALWKRSSRTYFGLDPNGSWKNSSAVTFSGNRGELVQLRVNHYRSFVQHVLTLAAGERPALQVRALNDSHEAVERTVFARGLLDSGFRKGVEESARRAALYALYLGEGWVYMVWDASRGELFTSDALGRPIYEGDIFTMPLRPIDVIRDPSSFPEGDAQDEWVIIRRRRNRWEMAAIHTEMEAHIRSMSSTDDIAWETFRWNEDYHGEDFGQDHIYTYELWHRPTPVLPQGRYACMVGDKIVAEGPAPEIPCFKIQPDQEEDSPFGYSPIFDLLGPQEAYDSFITTMLTTHDALGIPNLWTRRGDTLTATQIGGALRHIESDEPPQAVQLTEISQHTYRLEELMQDIFEKLTGISGTLRGEPPPNLESGSALALLDAKAVQYNSGFQGSWTHLIERLGKHMLNLYRRNVKNPRLAQITGEQGVFRAETWSGDSLQDLGDVVVEIGSPALMTVQGRRAIADKYAEMQWIKGPEQYSQVLATGRAEPVTKAGSNLLRLISEENARIRQGLPVRVLPMDCHSVHIREHLADLTASTDIRLDPAVQDAAANHIMEHYQAMEVMPPAIAMILGEPVNPMYGMQGGPGQGGNPPKPPGSEPQEGQMPAPPERPEMPTNPATGEQAQHPTGEY